MSDVALAAIMVGFFVLAIGLIRVLGWMIDRDPDGELDEDLDEEPDGR